MIEKEKIRSSFDRAAHTYQNTAQFQHAVCERLMQLIREEKLPAPVSILDGGAGTGFGAALLKEHWPQASLITCDLAIAMCQETARQGFISVCGDLETLPFASGKFDLLWSTLALQWCEHEKVYQELHRVLKPGGVLVFATLETGTLREFEEVFSAIDPYRHVLPFQTRDHIEETLRKSGFTECNCWSETWVTRHKDMKSLLNSIRGIGANQIGKGKRTGLMGKTAWGKAQSRYATLANEKGELPLSYKLVFAIAKKL